MTVDGAEIGTVAAVHDFGAGEILELRLRRAGGTSMMVPFTADVRAEHRHRRRTHRGGAASKTHRKATAANNPLAGQCIMWRATILTIFPEMFPGPLAASLAGKALAAGLWTLDADRHPRTRERPHRSVDDTPAGGGPGMVMRADVLARAIDAATAPDDPRPRLVMSARGVPLTQARVAALASGPGAASSAAASRASTSA